MARFFNTTGPCDPQRHYMLPPGGRLPDLHPFIERQQYFVLHAPRQTGKTTAMRAFAEELRGQGIVACWATVETTQGLDDTAKAEPLWIEALQARAAELPEPWRPPSDGRWIHGAVGGRFGAFLRAWAQRLSAPLVLLIDEADVLTGPAMVSFLRQLRAGFMDRGVGRFPTSVALIGMRDLRDYVVQSADGRALNLGSPFNVKAASITLRNFSAEEVAELVGQHTQSSGQPVAAEAIQELARLTGGQPFLVNSLADLCVTELVPDRSQPVTSATLALARERLILARTTHLDSLAERLREPRVATIVQAALLGDDPLSIAYDSDDFQYVLDLGLLRRGPEGAEAANPLYREVLVRQLTVNVQEAVPRPAWSWVTVDGRLDLPALLQAFRQWWRENADVLAVRAPHYPEAVPHLALCAFLQRVVNGGGRVHPEFAASRGAMDLLVAYGPDRFALEIKRLRSRDRREAVVARGADQLGRYLDTLGLDRGWLVVFDVRQERSWEERLWTQEVKVGGKAIHVIGC